MEEDICTSARSYIYDSYIPSPDRERTSSTTKKHRRRPTTVAVLVAALLSVGMLGGIAEGYWCVARSDASGDALQTSLDYACGAGADCAPIQSDGLCFLPNTIQAHASYAFNSYYQRNNMAPGACEFGGAATLAKTDPSYGSCVYPANPRTAGGGVLSSPANSPPTPTSGSSTYGTTPTTVDGGGTSSGSTPILGPPIPTTNSATPSSAAALLLVLLLPSVQIMMMGG